MCVYRAQKRAAWRQARLKSLEQDALQAQIMIQSLNTDNDDLTDPTNRRAKDMLDGVEEEEVSHPTMSQGFYLMDIAFFIINLPGVISYDEEKKKLLNLRPPFEVNNKSLLFVFLYDFPLAWASQSSF